MDLLKKISEKVSNELELISPFRGTWFLDWIWLQSQGGWGGTLQEYGFVLVISWYTGENWELKWIIPRNIPRFCLNQNLFLPIVFVTKKFEKFALMWRHFFIKIEKNNFSLTFLPDLLTSNGSGKLILELSQTKPFLAF